MSIFDLKYLAGGLEKEERKRALSDEELQGKISGLIDKRKYLVETKIPALKGTPDYEPAMKELQEIHTGLREAYDPKTNPGAIQKFGHLLTDHLGIKVNDPTLGQKVSLSDRRERKKYDKNQASLAEDLKEAEQDVAAGPLSPEQQAGVDARGTLAKFHEELKSKNDAWDELHPKSSQEEKDSAHAENGQQLIQTMYGTTGRGNWKQVTGKINGKPVTLNYESYTNKYTYPTGESVPQDAMETWIPDEKKVAPVKGGLIRTKPGQSSTGWVYTWHDKYDPNKIVGYTETTPSRYYQGTTTSRTTTDSFGVTSTSNAKTLPLNNQETDISSFGKVPVLSEDGSEVPAQQTPTQQNPHAESVPPAPKQKVSPVSATPSHKPTTSPKSVNPSATHNPEVKTMPTGSTKTTVNTVAGKPEIDAQGKLHIPSSDNYNQYLKSAAEQLLNGADLDKLPLPGRDKQAAANLAGKYGWDQQGLFTPKEKLLIRESKTYLTSALTSPSLKVLDSDKSRTKIANAIHASSGNPGMISSAIALKWHLTPAEDDFFSMYNQLVGTISGLGQLTRSGRITESGIKRLMTELPNPLTTQNSESAKNKLKRLISEIYVAENTGSLPTPTDQSQNKTSGTSAPKQENKPDLEEIRQQLLNYSREGEK